MNGTTRKITIQEEGFLSFLRPLMSTGLPLMKNVLRQLVKSIFVPLGLMAAGAATDQAIQNKIFGSGMTKLLFSTEELDDIMEVGKSSLKMAY